MTVLVLAILAQDGHFLTSFSQRTEASSTVGKILACAVGVFALGSWLILSLLRLSRALLVLFAFALVV